MSTRPLPTLEGVTSPPHAGAREPASRSSTPSRASGCAASAPTTAIEIPASPGSTTCCCGAARFEVARRKASFAYLRGDDLDDIAQHAAEDALVSVLRRLPDFRG